MKTSQINFLLSLVIIVALCILFNSILDTNKRIDILNNNLVDITVCNEQVIEKISNQSYKEELYLNQLSNSTTLVLSVIGFAIVIGGIFSYVNLNERFKSQDESSTVFRASIEKLVKRNSKNTEKYKTDSEKIEHGLLELKNKLDFQIFHIDEEKSRDRLDKKEYAMGVFYMLSSLKHLSDFMIYIKEERTNDYDVCLTTLNLMLKSFLSEAEKLEKIKSEDYFNNETIIELIEDINQLKDDKVYSLLSKVYNTIEFTEEK